MMTGTEANSPIWGNTHDSTRKGREVSKVQLTTSRHDAGLCEQLI